MTITVTDPSGKQVLSFSVASGGWSKWPEERDDPANTVSGVKTW